MTAEGVHEVVVPELEPFACSTGLDCHDATLRIESGYRALLEPDPGLRHQVREPVLREALTCQELVISHPLVEILARADEGDRDGPCIGLRCDSHRRHQSGISGPDDDDIRCLLLSHLDVPLHSWLPTTRQETCRRCDRFSPSRRPGRCLGSANPKPETARTSPLIRRSVPSSQL